jgi:tryptophanase
MDYVIEVAEEVARRKDSLRGFRIVEEAPHLRHFSARLAPVGREQEGGPRPVARAAPNAAPAGGRT